MEYYDVIIAGAGPAGLMLAKELSKKQTVLVLEKGELGKTNKSWLTYEDRWKKEKFPKTYITNTFNRWHFPIPFCGDDVEFYADDRFVVIDETK
ncbi:MAG: FAD-dependent monooxygenase [Candidatus Woesearchaeota archaeon]